MELVPATGLAGTYVVPAAGLGTAALPPLMGPETWQPKGTQVPFSLVPVLTGGPAHREPVALLHLASCPDGSSHGGGGPHHCAHPDLQPVPWPAPSVHAGTSVLHLDDCHGCQARPQPDLDCSGPEPLLLLLRQPLFPIISSHSFPIIPTPLRCVPSGPQTCTLFRQIEVALWSEHFRAIKRLKT